MARNLKVELAAVRLYLALTETSAIDVNKPYKPRKLKTDQYHNDQRETYKNTPHEVKEKQSKTRKKWTQKNKEALRKRSEVVREQKKNQGLS